MTATNAIAVTLGTMATIAIAVDDVVARDMQDLLDHGFEVVSEGQLQELVECRRWTLRVLPQAVPDDCKERLGSFRRLKGGSEEFVCVSFRGWACYQSQNPN
jgi:hypothetical protein